MTDLNKQPVETAKQPAIADVLAITYDEPISDDKAWSKIFPDVTMAPAAPTKEMFTGHVGDMARLIAPHVAWDPTAFVAQTLVAVGNWLGFRHFIAEEATNRRASMAPGVRFSRWDRRRDRTRGCRSCPCRRTPRAPMDWGCPTHGTRSRSSRSAGGGHRR